MRTRAFLGFCLTVGLAAGCALADPPSSVNWVERGAVSPVRDQGMCGGDYAFAGAGAVNSLHAIFGNGLADVSEQQLLDCSSAYGGKGCPGGSLHTAFDYIAANGATTRDAYPTTGTSGECKINGGAIKISGYTDIPKGDCGALEAAVARQPVMAVINGESLNDYSGGILSSNATDLNLDHAVLVVGYTPDYWLVQNSWGSSWGEQGYVRLQRGDRIGICDLATYPKF